MASERKTVARVKFLRDHIHTPSAERRVSIKYPSGWEGPVSAECAEKAIAANAAKPLKAEKTDDSRPEVTEDQPATEVG